MTTANQNLLPIASAFEKGHKFFDVDVEEIVPHIQTTQCTQCQARVKTYDDDDDDELY